LQTLCAIISSPHFEQATKLGITILHVWARLLSRLPFESLPLGQIGISYTSFFLDTFLETPKRYKFNNFTE